MKAQAFIYRVSHKSLSDYGIKQIDNDMRIMLTTTVF